MSRHIYIHKYLILYIHCTILIRTQRLQYKAFDVILKKTLQSFVKYDQHSGLAHLPENRD